MEANLNEQTLIDVLLNAQQRDALLAAMLAEQGTTLALTNRYEWVAPRCAATPEQLRAVIAALDTPDRRYNPLIEELTFHPQMPDDLLLDLAQQNRCVVALAHRSGPRALLEYIAQRFGISEAITTLALSYSTADSLEAFEAFVRRHQADRMLRYNLPRAAHLTAAQRAIVQAIIGDDAAARPDR